MKNILNVSLYNEDLNRVVKDLDLNSLKNESILITGGLGLIGSAVVDLLHKANELLKLNINIFVAGRNEKLFLEKYSSFHDIIFLQYDAMKPIVFSNHFSYIICCAGVASPQLYVEKPVETLMTTIDGIKNLLNYSLEKKVKKLLFLSSTEVYGKKNDNTPFEENSYGSISIDNVRSSYAIGKKMGELLCKAYKEEYGLNCSIVRPGHIFGPTATMYDKRVSSDFAYLSAQKKDLYMKSEGAQKRSYCYSLDCAKAILIVLLYGSSAEAYNIGHDETTTIKQMATYMAKAGNVELKIESPLKKDLKVFNPMDNSTLNNNKIKSLGYKDSFSVQEACEHTVKILREILQN